MVDAVQWKGNNKTEVYEFFDRYATPRKKVGNQIQYKDYAGEIATTYLNGFMVWDEKYQKIINYSEELFKQYFQELKEELQMYTKQDIEKWRKKLDFRITDSKSEYHHHHIIEEFAYKYDLTIPQATTILESTRTLVRNK